MNLHKTAPKKSIFRAAARDRVRNAALPCTGTVGHSIAQAAPTLVAAQCLKHERRLQSGSLLRSTRLLRVSHVFKVLTSFCECRHYPGLAGVAFEHLTLEAPTVAAAQCLKHKRRLQID